MEYQSYQSYQNRPKANSRNAFAIASLITGVLALFSIITVFFPLVFGALGILFAVLSHRKNILLDTRALIGTIASVIGLSFSTVVLVISITLLPTYLRTPEYREQLNEAAQSMYGITFDEMMEESYGIDLDDLLESK